MSETREDFERPDWMHELWSADRDRAIADELVRKGVVSASRLEEARREQANGPATVRVLEVFVSRGWVTPAAIEEARKSIEVEEFARAAAPRTITPTPPEVAEAARDPGRLLGDFVLVSPLGSGGAGDVWKAWERAMGRWVALKVPRMLPSSRVQWERFQREALAAGRLNHPGIVPVYAAGEVQGR